MTTADAVLRDAGARLAAQGVPDPMRDARRLLEHVAGRRFGSDVIVEELRLRFDALVARRCAREPVSHLVGRRAFWCHDFEIGPDVLDPRPETETLVEAALRGSFGTVLDLGTGSGAIILSLLTERPAALGLATDISERALAVAQRNAGRLDVAPRLQVLRSDWCEAVTGRFDLIVSNPPYIALSEMAALAPELSFEPRVALTDEADGLSAYRRIAASVPDHLAQGGRVLVEIGPSQGASVRGLFEAAGLAEITVLKDLDGRDRVVAASAASDENPPFAR